MATERPFAASMRALRAIDRAGTLEVRVGILQPNGVQPRGEGEAITQAELAAELEFGVPRDDGEGWRIPPRPAHQDAAAKHGSSWQDRMGDAIREVVDQAWADSPPTMPASLLVLSAQARADVRREIPYFAVPNAALTVELKGSSSPLIDTGDLANSIRAQATDGDTVRTTG